GSDRVRDSGPVLLAGQQRLPGVQVREIAETLAAVPQEARTNLQPARGAKVRMARDADAAPASNLRQDVVRRLGRADELTDVERDDGGVVFAADVMLGNLGAGYDEKIVQAAGPIRFFENLGAVLVESLRGDGKLPEVVGNRDDVELAGSPVPIDDVAD